jgi:hypothetical protein
MMLGQKITEASVTASMYYAVILSSGHKLEGYCNIHVIAPRDHGVAYTENTPKTATHNAM